MAVLRLLLIIYQALYLLVLALMLPYELLRRPKRAKLRWLRERSGFLRVPASTKPRLWLHAVSVGEALAARTLVERLCSEYDIAVSTVTDTGQAVAGRFVPEGNLFYAPFDLMVPTGRYLKRLSPEAVLVMETELWPMLYWQCYRRGIPLVLVNGRLSERSFRGYRKVRFFMKRLLTLGSLYCMQTEADAKRLMALGAPEDRVVVTGNIKLDITPPEGPPEWASGLGHPLIVAGSTHEHEEEILLQTYKRLKQRFPALVLVLAPRHPERFSKVESLLKGMNYGKRSEMDIQGRDVVLLDSIGELTALYGAADICIIGGSFVPVGGHNIFEPACWGKPVVTGPHMDNFPLAEEFFKQSAAIKTTREELYETLIKLLTDRGYANQIGKKAREVFSRFQGATDRTLQAIERVLQPGGSKKGPGKVAHQHRIKDRT